jgi:hypothetical protein
VPVLSQFLSEGGSNKPGPAGDKHFHGSLFLIFYRFAIKSVAEKGCPVQVFSDPEARQDEIVSYRIAGAQFPECLCNFYGRSQISLLALCEPQCHGDTMHVSVQRNNQFGGRHRLPSAGVNVITSHHPAKEKVEPFAGTPLARSWNQEITTFRKYILHKGRKGWNYAGIIMAKAGNKAFLKGTVLLDDPPHAPEQVGKILSCGEPVFEIGGDFSNLVERRAEKKS